MVLSKDALARRVAQRDNFQYFAETCLKIRSKTGDIIPLKLNPAQLKLQAQIDDQIKRTGKVRLVVLKARQLGASTFTEGRFIWRAAQQEGIKAYVITQVGTSTTALFDMTKRYWENLPPYIKPSISKNNANELVFDQLQSSFKVSTAGSSTGGRGETIQLFHGSEVAFWPNEKEIVEGVINAIADLPGTEIILESTPNGASGMFYELCMAASKGEGDFELVFLPWFMDPEYKRPFTDRVKLSPDDLAYQKQYNLTNEQMAFRYFKSLPPSSPTSFRQEYPATVEEAFQADVTGALWKRLDIDQNRTRDLSIRDNRDFFSRIVMGIDPATTANKNSDETGINVSGLGHDGKVYVLEDQSGKLSITEWVNRVIQLYDKYDVDKIIAETNQGGDMVLNSLLSVRPDLNLAGMHVSQSKRVRHEHVHAQYTRNQVIHVGDHKLLEDAMCNWVPGKSKFSPDRVDALCLAVQDLLLDYHYNFDEDFFIA